MSFKVEVYDNVFNGIGYDRVFKYVGYCHGFATGGSLMRGSGDLYAVAIVEDSDGNFEEVCVDYIKRVDDVF